MEKYRNEIRRMMISVNVIDGIYAASAKKIGVKDSTVALLYALDDGNSYSQKEICEQWFIPKTTLNTIVRECVGAGYIILENSGHRREKKIRITTKGSEYARTILNPIYEMERRAMEKTLEAFSPEFISAVEQFTAHLKEEAKHFTAESD